MQYRISFQQIEYFMTIAENLSFTEAAKSLYVSQPALSKQISVLERELGFPLFIRDRRRVALSPEGASLYHDWKAVLKQLESSIYNAQLLRENAKGELNIGCSETFDYSDILPEMISDFTGMYENVEINLVSYPSRQMREDFKKNKVDLLLIPYFELAGMVSDEICWMKIREIPLSFIIPASNPLSKKKSISPTDLKDEKFILMSPKDSPGGAERTQTFFMRCGFKIRNARYVPNINSLVMGVKNGLGIALADSAQFENMPDVARVFPAPLLMDDSYMIAVWKKERKNVAADLFINLLQEKFPNQVH